jgi:hypothetical protein
VHNEMDKVVMILVENPHMVCKSLCLAARSLCKIPQGAADARLGGTF